MNPVACLLCLVLVLPNTFAAFQKASSTSAPGTLAAERRELAEIRLVLEVERDFRGAKPRLAKLVETLAARSEPEAKDLAAEVERVALEVRRALGEDVPGDRSGRDAVDRAVQDALVRGDLAFLGQLGRHAVPGLVRAVRAAPGAFPGNGEDDPLVVLAQQDALAASQLAQELIDEEGFFWKKRVVRMLGYVQLDAEPLWSSAPESRWLGEGLSRTAEKYAEDPDVGSQAFEFLVALAHRGRRSDAFEPILTRGLRSAEARRRQRAEELVERLPESVGRAGFEAFLHEPDARLRAWAGQMLVHQYPDSQKLLEHVGDADPGVRLTVVRWLGERQRWSRDEHAALARLLRDEDTKVGDAAWEVLASLPVVKQELLFPTQHLFLGQGPTRYSRSVLQDPLPDGFVEALLATETKTERRVTLGRLALSLPAAQCFETLVQLADTGDPLLLSKIEEALPRAAAGEDLDGFLRVASVLADMRDPTDRGAVYARFSGLNATRVGMEALLRWSLARDDEAVRRATEPNPLIDVRPSVEVGKLVQLDPSLVVEFVVRAYGTNWGQGSVGELCGDEVARSPELIAALRDLARDEGRATPPGLRTLALRAAFAREVADEDALSIALSIASDPGWRDPVQLARGIESMQELLGWLEDSRANAVILRMLRDPSLPEALAIAAASSLAEAAKGADEIVKLVLARGFERDGWSGPVEVVIQAMGSFPALQDAEALGKAARRTEFFRSALSAIGNLRDARYLPLLSEIVARPDWPTQRDRATEALCNFLDVEAVEPLLVAAVQTPHVELRDLCLAQLEKIREYQDAKEGWAARRVQTQTREQVVVQLVAQLDAKSDDIKVQAIRALATWEAIEVMPRLIELTASGSKSVATAAREALARLNQLPEERRKE
jgi:hypothetical protein